MMYFIVIAMAAAVWAEPPISKSYLPPSANGYPKGPQGFQETQGLQSHGLQSHGLQSHGLQSHDLQSHGLQSPQGVFAGAPEVVAARSFTRGREQTLGNNFARKSLQDSANSEGYDAFGRNREAAAYEFGYTVDAEHDMGQSGYETGRSGGSQDYEGRSGGAQFGHHEEGRSGGARGEYHVVLPDGRKQTVSYEADERGFKPKISYQDSGDFTRSGYDSNARDIQNGARGNHGNEHGHDLHGDARSNGY